MGRSSRIGRLQLPHRGRSSIRPRSTRFSVEQNGHGTVARRPSVVSERLAPSALMARMAFGSYILVSRGGFDHLRGARTHGLVHASVLLTALSFLDTIGRLRRGARAVATSEM